MAAPRAYDRLPGTYRLFSVHTAWAADTHLMSVETVWVVDRYRRFYYRDIQGFLLEPTNWRRNWNLAVGLGGGGFGLLLFLAGASDSAATGLIVSSFWLVPTLIFLLVNSLSGPGARLTVVTAVQSYALPSVRRRRTALKILQRLDPLIRAAQADLAAPPAAPAAPVAPPPVFSLGT